MTSHVLYSSHHPQYIWNGLYCICVIKTNLMMDSDQLYVWHHTHFTYAIVWTLHNITSTLYDFTPMYLSHYIHCIHDITHPIYDITHMAIETLYLLFDPLYQHYTHCICVIKLTISVIPHPLSVWHHTHYTCDIIFSIHAITKDIYDIIPLYV